jgi:hypothetical protein
MSNPVKKTTLANAIEDISIDEGVAEEMTLSIFRDIFAMAGKPGPDHKRACSRAMAGKAAA